MFRSEEDLQLGDGWTLSAVQRKEIVSEFSYLLTHPSTSTTSLRGVLT